MPQNQLSFTPFQPETVKADTKPLSFTPFVPTPQESAPVRYGKGIYEFGTELYDQINTGAKTALERIGEGNYPAAFGAIAAPITEPFTELMRMGVNKVQGKPIVEEPENPDERYKQGMTSIAGAVGFPAKGFREAWDAEDYPRLAGQATGALAGVMLPHMVGKRLGKIDVSIEPEVGPEGHTASAPVDMTPAPRPAPPRDVVSDLYDLGYSDSDIMNLDPNQIPEIITNKVENSGPNTAFAEYMKRQQRTEPPPPVVEQGAPSPGPREMETHVFDGPTPTREEQAIWRQNGWTPAGMQNGYPLWTRPVGTVDAAFRPPTHLTAADVPGPVAGNEVAIRPGQDIPWDGPINKTVLENFKKDGYGLVVEQGKNLFRKLVSSESGEFIPDILWDRIRSYFGDGNTNPDSRREWEEIASRARLAGDHEAADVAVEALRDYDQPVQGELPGAQSNITPAAIDQSPYSFETRYFGIEPDYVGYDTQEARTIGPSESLQLLDFWTRYQDAAVANGDTITANHAETMAQIIRSRMQEHVNTLHTTPEPQVGQWESENQMFEPDPVAQARMGYTPAADNLSLPRIPITESNQAWDLISKWREMELDAYRTGDDAAAEYAVNRQSEIHLYLDTVGEAENRGLPRPPANLPDPSQHPAYATIALREADMRAVNATRTLEDALRVRDDFERRNSATDDPIEGRHLANMIERINRVIQDNTPRPIEQPISTGDKNRWNEWHQAIGNMYPKWPEGGVLYPENEPMQQMLGVHELNRLGEIDNARLTSEFPIEGSNLPPVVGMPAETARMTQLRQPGMQFKQSRVAQSLKVPREDIVMALKAAEEQSSHMSGGPRQSQIEAMTPAERRAANASDTWREWALDQVRAEGDGAPGLEIKDPYDNGSYIAAIYRNPQGKPVAVASGHGGGRNTPGTISTLAADHTSGLYGRGTFAVLNAAYQKGLRLAGGGISPHTRDLLKTVLRLIDEQGGHLDVDRIRELGGELARLGGKLFSDETGAVNLDGESWRKMKEGAGWGQGGAMKPTDAEVLAKQKEANPNFLKEAIQMPTSATTIADVSAPGRQGLPLIFTKQFWQAVPKMYKAGLSAKNFDTIDAAIRELPIHQQLRDKNTGKLLPSIAEQMGVDLMAPGHKAGPREEATASRWLETGGTIPYISAAYRGSYGKVARFSNRSFTTFLNSLRSNRAQYLMDAARDMSVGALESGEARPNIFKQKYTPQEAMELNPYFNKELAREIGDFVNTATGRGPLKTHLIPYKGAELSLEGAADKLGYVLFSPRNIASKVRMMNPSTYIMASPFVRKQYLKAMIGATAAWAAFSTMAKMGGGDDVEVNDQWTNSDFGKIKIGNTRLDPAGGFQQYLVLFSRAMAGGYTSSASGEWHKFGEGYNPETLKTTALRFGENKLNPVAKFAWDLFDASDYKPFNMADRTAQLFVPLAAQDLIGLYQENPSLLPWMLPILHGWGTQIYDKDENPGRLIPSEYDRVITGGGPLDWAGLRQPEY